MTGRSAADDMDDWNGDSSKAKVAASTATPSAPMRVELLGDVADDIEGWAADVDPRAATEAGYRGPNNAGIKTIASSNTAAAPTAPPRLKTAAENAADLERWVARLKTLPVNSSAHKFDRAAICETLEAIEQIPVTMHDLRETQLGVLTQPYKDSPDIQVQTIARRLRKSWKAVVQAAEGPETSA